MTSVSSAELKHLQHEPKCSAGLVRLRGHLSSWRTHGLKLAGALHELACGARVADGRALADFEDGSEMERIGAVDKSLFELTVYPQTLDGPGQSVQDLHDMGVADALEVDGTLLGEQ